MSLVIFIVVISLLVIVHEWGHFIMAKRLGVKVERFSVGFGPKLYSFVHQETEFMICAIPLGGYVKMAGDERLSCRGRPEEYYSHSPGHRALIVMMGPVVNYLLAYLCLWVVFVIGYPTLSPKVGRVLEGYPAHTAGLQKGDTIIRIDRKNIQSWEDVQKSIAASDQAQLNFVFIRDGRKMEKTIAPKEEFSENILHQTIKARRVGIVPEEEIVVLKYNPIESLGKSFTSLADITTTTAQAVWRMATGALSPKEAMTGPVGIFFIIQKAAHMGFSYLLYIVGIISASLAIFNLLPFPVLDGGHLVFLGIEKIRGKALPVKVDEAISRIGVSLIIFLALYVCYIDLDRLGWIDKLMTFWNQMGL